MVYLIIFISLITGIIALTVANIIVKKKIKNKHSEKGEQE